MVVSKGISTMNEQVKKLRNIASKMAELGIAMPETLADSLDGLDNPHCKIAIVGRFQTGKSHLINETFLNQNLLLKEGVGLCTTAVTTEIAFGETPRLTVEYKGDEPTKIVDNPSAEDIHVAVGASDDAGRVALAAKVKSVRLEWPCAALKNVTLFDTAGIDDPNPELLRATTYRTIPESDAAVMVVGAKALSSVELDFLKRGVFSCGLGRVMVLVSYRHDVDALSDEGRAKVLETIKGQLEGIGKGDVPVSMVSYDPVVTGNVLNNPADIRAAFLSYAQSASFGNRAGKVAVALKKILGDHIRELEFKLSIADKNDEELEIVRRRLVELAEELRGERDELWHGFGAAAAEIREDATLTLRSCCGDIVRRYVEGFETCDGFGEAQKRAGEAEGALTPQFDDAAVRAFDVIRAKIGGEIAKCGSRLAEVCGEFPLTPCPTGSDIKIDGGFCGNWNSTLVTIGDYLLTMLLLPGGIFMSWCLRFVWGQIPVVGSFVPSELLKGHMVSKVEQSLLSGVDDFCGRFGKCADEALGRLREDVFKTVTDEIDTKMREAVDAVEARRNGGAGDGANEIREELAVCRELIREI